MRSIYQFVIIIVEGFSFEHKQHNIHSFNARSYLSETQLCDLRVLSFVFDI